MPLLLRLLLPLPLLLLAPQAEAAGERWRAAWPRTDFTKSAVDLEEIRSGGPPKDGIPSIDDPAFRPVAEVEGLDPGESVITLVIAGDARAYPLRILIWHEIVNDRVGGLPVAVTYCPLCNAALVFERRVEGRELDFGTTGKLRFSDLVMYDRQTESWWQQFEGRAIVGELTGTLLPILPARLLDWASFKARFPDGRVLVPKDPEFRPYGSNPYVGYDSAAAPFLYSGPLPEGIAPLAYVVAVGEEAWPLVLLQAQGSIEAGDLRITWREGARSALDSADMAAGRKIGSVAVERRQPDGSTQPVPHTLTFAFVFHAFHPEGRLHIP